jgi:SPX domain protein involved in polyphosphate accumulation
MAIDQVQRSRYELKYTVDEPRARQVRDFARSYLRRDPNANPALRYSYPIYSIYLDDARYGLYHAVTHGLKNRYKLRVRYYNFNASEPVYFEIKRRVGEVILKDRAMVRREVAAELLRGRCPRPDDLREPSDTDGWSVLHRFCEMSRNINAQPRLIVAYQREAWVTTGDDNARLTFDRKVAACQYRGELTTDRWIYPALEGAVLELKFADRFPTWMRELSLNCNLYRTRLGKYVECLPRIAEACPQLCQL